MVFSVENNEEEGNRTPVLEFEAPCFTVKLLLLFKIKFYLHYIDNTIPITIENIQKMKHKVPIFLWLAENNQRAIKVLNTNLKLFKRFSFFDFVIKKFLRVNKTHIDENSQSYIIRLQK